MKLSLCFILLSIFMMGSISNADFIDWGKVDLGCTVSCGAYWACVFRQGSGCISPSRCDCSQFAGKR